MSESDIDNHSLSLSNLIGSRTKNKGNRWHHKIETASIYRVTILRFQSVKQRNFYRCKNSISHSWLPAIFSKLDNGAD